MRISDWSSDVCSSDLGPDAPLRAARRLNRHPAAPGAATASVSKRIHIDESIRPRPEARLLRMCVQVLRSRKQGRALSEVWRHGGAGQASGKRPAGEEEIGRASWRERVCQYV